MILHTRKSLGDEYGVRTFYVVEVYSCGTWWHIGHGHYARAAAVSAKNKYYKEYKSTCSLARKNLRIAVYVRAERDE